MVPRFGSHCRGVEEASESNNELNYGNLLQIPLCFSYKIVGNCELHCETWQPVEAETWDRPPPNDNRAAFPAMFQELEAKRDPRMCHCFC